MLAGPKRPDDSEQPDSTHTARETRWCATLGQWLRSGYMTDAQIVDKVKWVYGEKGSQSRYHDERSQYGGRSGYRPKGRQRRA